MHSNPPLERPNSRLPFSAARRQTVKLQALILDVDGTLAETERDARRLAFKRAFAPSGLDWEWSVASYRELLAVTGSQGNALIWCSCASGTKKQQAKWTMDY
jgi:phosphoglycolate phosphatase-like HAD superfamily hydrolase